MTTDKLEALLADITPGPWAYEDPLGPEILTVVANTEAAPYDWVWVANIDTVPSLQEMAEDDRTFTEHESNARLIALAPDLLAEVIRLRGEVERLREALQGLEYACEQLSATRTREIYLAMIDGGQTDALLALDGRRTAARAALTTGVSDA